ncbi:MAG: terminase family protein [Elusimicrobiaceae bacterium]|nr:terminase family protein [Elusimicrobiaceae bacterium]
MSRSADTTTARRITLPYKPRYPQNEIHQALQTHRFCVLVTHRQMGKSVCAINHLIKSALQNSRQAPRYFYISPFLKQTKMIAWDYLKRFTAPLPGIKLTETELCAQMPNGAKIWLLGADNPDALRGTYADGVVLDEYAQIKPAVFEEIVRPMLLSRQGWAVFTGTPKGQNQFYELFLHAQKAAQTDPQCWWCGVYPADQTGVISAEELAEIRRHTPPHLFQQEYLCDFTADADDVLISLSWAVAASARQYGSAALAHAPRIIGVDPARFGSDRSVIFRRQGWQAFSPDIFSKTDQMTLAARVAEQIKNFRPDAVFIDSGCGGGVIDRLRQLGFGITEVNFGASALKCGQYVNKRAEMWGEMAQWLQDGGAIPAEGALRADLCAVRYSFDSAGRMKLESKDELKARTGRSPDLADALALTFAYPVQKGANRQSCFAKTEYNVL